MAWRTSLKLHKLFVAEVGRAERLEREGEQVLASLANVSQRLPLLSAASSSSSGPDGGQNADSVMGVLAFSPNAQSLLLQRHFAALEKSRGFLAGILRDYQELVRRLQTLATEFFDAQTLISSEEAIASDGGGGDDNSPAVASLRRLEWMEDVARMFQRELLRKQRLVEQLEYHDAARLAAVHKQWPSRSRWSNVSVDYVEAGLTPPPTVEAKSADAGRDDAGSSGKSSKQNQKKKKKKKSKAPS